jgi:hypothetical protein
VFAVSLLMVMTNTVGGTRLGAATPDSSGQVYGSVAAPTAERTSPICAAPDPTPNLGPKAQFPKRPIRTLIKPSTGVINFSATSSGLYVNTGATLATYTLSGRRLGSFTLPARLSGGNQVSQPIVSPNGDIYLAGYHGKTVEKFSPDGKLLWSVDPGGGNPTGLFAIGSGRSFAIAVSIDQNRTSSDVLDLSTGSVVRQFPYVDNGGFVTQMSKGHLLATGDGYVTTLDRSGKVLARFGSLRIKGAGMHTGSGTQFYYPAQAVQGGDGTIYSADPLSTIEATAPNGDLQGLTTVGDKLTMGGYGLYLEGPTLYFQGGQPFDNAADNISSISLATLRSYLDGPHAPTDSLGWGAGLEASTTANYFAPGTTPSVSATLDSWWTPRADHLKLTYAVENERTLAREAVPAPKSIELPTTAAGLSHVPLTIPEVDREPGPYLVQASLFDTATSPPTKLGTTCMPYTVGAPGDSLDLTVLPPGIDGGGPADARGVALSAQLGLNGYRSGRVVDWSSILPTCSASDPSPSTCGPSAMTFATTSDDDFQAAARALSVGVRYWLQVSGGDAVSMALVNSGLWEGDVARLVAHYATPPAGCGACAPVTTWEPWNEPNNTGWADGGRYVAKVLEPFDAAVKSVEPGTGSTVVGGSSLDIPMSWWRQLVAAGGLRALDVASVHPYPGNNDAFEEWGDVDQVKELQALIGPTPLWFTEVGWWSDGNYNFVHQADAVSRAMIWQKVLGIPVWGYFFTEGDFGDGVSFSLIQAGNTDDYVKPAALATMTTSQEIGSRPYAGLGNTGIPSTYEARFGPVPMVSTASSESTAPTDLAAVWSDGLSVNGSLTISRPGGGSVPVTLTSEYGRVAHLSLVAGRSYRLALSDQVTFLTYPTDATASVAPTRAYGADVAAERGTSATASSGDASKAVAGTVAGPGWSSAANDVTPELTVALAKPTVIDRVVVDTQSVGSTATGVRNYVVWVERPSGGWEKVAAVVAQFRFHQEQLAFRPVTTKEVRIAVSTVNFGGYYGGGIPPFWPSGMVGTAYLHAVEVYRGTATPAQIAGSPLAALPRT